VFELLFYGIYIFYSTILAVHLITSGTSAPGTYEHMLPRGKAPVGDPSDEFEIERSLSQIDAVRLVIFHIRRTPIQVIKLINATIHIIAD
jgi:hypothetical protein